MRMLCAHFLYLQCSGGQEIGLCAIKEALEMMNFLIKKWDHMDLRVTFIFH